MRTRYADIPFRDPTGTGRVFLTEYDGLVKVTIDKLPRSQPHAGVLIHASLTEAQAATLRDALDAWLRRNEPAPVSPEKPRL
jgi:hypothetical protein